MPFRELVARMQVNKIVVIGSGVMGSGIASEAANGGLDVLLLDIVPEGARNRNALAEQAIEKQLKSGGFAHPSRKKYVTAGNLEDDLEGLGEADWIIEVVDGLAANGEEGNAAVEAKVKGEVEALCGKFPIYPTL